MRILLYGKRYTTSTIFIHVLRHLFIHNREQIGDCQFHLLLDDRRDKDLAASLLPQGQVTLHAQYEEMDPTHSGTTLPTSLIREWEERYGSPHLRAYIIAERILAGRSDQERWRYLLNHIDYLEKLCRRIQPDLFVSGPAAALPSWVAIRVLQGNDIPCLILSSGRFGDRVFLPHDPYERLGVESIYLQKRQSGLSAGEKATVEELLTQYRLKNVRSPDFLTVRKTTRMRLLPRPSRLWRTLWESHRTDHRYYDEPFSSILGRAIRARRSYFYQAALRSHWLSRISEYPKFFFFPLQFEPEMSLSTLGRGWTDQLELIRLVSESLPIDRWLYVKEHPMMCPGVRPWRFYRELLRLPRVRLLDQRLDSYAVIPHVEGIVTLGSTAGWEALMFRKPVLLIGHAFYEEFREGVALLNRVEDIPSILRKMRNWTISEDALMAFIAAVLTKAPKGILLEPRYFPDRAGEVLSSENLRCLGDILLDRIKQAREIHQTQFATH